MMTMLTGVVVQAVGVLAAVEKESAIVGFCAQHLRQVFTQMGRDTEARLTHEEFRYLLVQPEITVLCDEVGVDIVGLLERSETIYESLEVEEADDGSVAAPLMP